MRNQYQIAPLLDLIGMSNLSKAVLPLSTKAKGRTIILIREKPQNLDAFRDCMIISRRSRQFWWDLNKFFIQFKQLLSKFVVSKLVGKSKKNKPNFPFYFSSARADFADTRFMRKIISQEKLPLSFAPGKEFICSSTECLSICSFSEKPQVSMCFFLTKPLARRWLPAFLSCTIEILHSYTDAQFSLLEKNCKKTQK